MLVPPNLRLYENSPYGDSVSYGAAVMKRFIHGPIEDALKVKSSDGRFN